MNTWLLGAGALALLTTALHIIGGQITLIRPFLRTDLAPDIKGCLLVCWHVVSVFLLLTACLYLYTGINNPPEFDLLLNALSGFYLLFALLFIGIGWSFFSFHTLYKLPQWTLLLPIGVIGLMGTTSS